jgi:hypothetical protein
MVGGSRNTMPVRSARTIVKTPNSEILPHLNIHRFRHTVIDNLRTSKNSDGKHPTLPEIAMVVGQKPEEVSSSDHQSVSPRI